MDPIRIFISCSAVERVPAEVLAFTVREHASRECDIRFTYECIPPIPPIARSDARPRTNFSYHRFCAPALCGYKGRALSCDSDMLCFADIAEIFDAPMPNGANVITARPDKPHQRSSFCVIDCERVRWDIDEIVGRINSGALTYHELMMFDKMGVVWCDGPKGWNDLDVWTPETKNMHMTSIPNQPWAPHKPKHPWGHLWFSARDRMLAAASTLFPTSAPAPAKWPD